MCAGIMDPDDPRYGCDCHLTRADNWGACLNCYGQGYIEDEEGKWTCSECNGSGEVEIEEAYDGSS